MFILQKRSSLLLILLFFLSSCYFFMPIEPIARIDDEFILEYGREVQRAKKKYYRGLAEASYYDQVDFKKTAYGKLLQAEMDFIEQNAKNNPFQKINTTRDKFESKVTYVSYNTGPYKAVKNNIFDEIVIPNDDFQYYNLGKKEFNEINNIELQEAYDYLYLINQETARQMEIAKLRAEEQKKKQSTQKQETTIIDKTRENLKSLTDRIKGLINTTTN